MAVPQLEVIGDKTQTPIRHAGDVRVHGMICEGRDTEVGGTLTVTGAVEAVTLNCSGPAVVDGGIIGKQKGRYTVGGELQCRFITGATVMCRANVTVQSEIVHSRLTCVGKLDVSQGVLYGGDVAANGGVRCRTLGHTSGIPTLVEAGNGRALRLLTDTITAQIEGNRKKVATVRCSVEPLLKQMKSLSPQQREKATELLYEAGEMEAATATMVAAFEQRKKLIRSQAKPEIYVDDIVHAGVTVRFDGLEALLTVPMKGPLTLTTRKTDGGTEIVAIDSADGSACVIPSSRPGEPAAAA